MISFNLAASLWYKYPPLPIWPSLLTPLLPFSFPSPLWLCQSLVSWSTSIGHLGFKVDTCGLSLPCFHGSLGKTDLGTLEIGGLSPLRVLEHMG